MPRINFDELVEPPLRALNLDSFINNINVATSVPYNFSWEPNPWVSLGTLAEDQPVVEDPNKEYIEAGLSGFQISAYKGYKKTCKNYNVKPMSPTSFLQQYPRGMLNLLRSRHGNKCHDMRNYMENYQGIYVW